MSAKTGARRAVKAVRGRLLGAGRWLGLAEGGAPRPAEGRKWPLSWEDVPEPARRAGRWVAVRGWASMIVWPWRWTGGATTTGAALAAWAGTWLPISIGLLPAGAVLGAMICGLRPRVIILSDVSSRVKTLRLARRLRRRWHSEMHQLGLARERQRRGEAVSLVPELEKRRLGEFGVTAEVDLHRLGLILEDLGRHRKRLESVFLARCTMELRGYATAVLEFRHTDPLSRPVPVDTLPAAQRRLHVVTRVDERGRPVEQDVILPRLIIGSAGSGKSTELRTYLHALQREKIPFRLRAFDPKGGMELGDLREAAHVYESRPNRWPDFLGQAVEAMQSRQRSLAARGWSKLTRFTDADPLDILVIDELLAVVGQRAERVRTPRLGDMRADDALNLLLSQGRAAGYTAVGLSQLLQKEILGHARALFPHLTVLRLPPSEKEIVDRLLGPDHPAHLIPAGPQWAGVGYTRTPEGQTVRSRGALMTGDQWREVVNQIAEDKARRTAARRQRREKAEAVA